MTTCSLRKIEGEIELNTLTKAKIWAIVFIFFTINNVMGFSGTLVEELLGGKDHTFLGLTNTFEGVITIQTVIMIFTGLITLSTVKDWKKEQDRSTKQTWSSDSFT